MSVDTRPPANPAAYAFFEQDGLRVYYSPKLARKSHVLELDYVRVLFRNTPVLSGPENLLASIITGRL